jgi:hypothetical protein
MNIMDKIPSPTARVLWFKNFVSEKNRTTYSINVKLKARRDVDGIYYFVVMTITNQDNEIEFKKVYSLLSLNDVNKDVASYVDSPIATRIVTWAKVKTSTVNRS